MQTASVTVSIASSQDHIQGILSLQGANISEVLSPEDREEQGFLTVRHHAGLLSKMAGSAPQVIALDRGKVVGYVLAMDKALQHDIPVLQPMFKEFEHLYYGSRKISSFPYIVCGQACVDRAYRGTGLLKKLYEGMKVRLAPAYRFCITEIAVSNARSMAAHGRIGFETIHTYWDGKEHWNIVIWDWEK